jgi:hypothetical protein
VEEGALKVLLGRAAAGMFAVVMVHGWQNDLRR